MFDINIEFDEINISSIENQDLKSVQNWFNNEGLGYKTENPLKFNDFYKRFIEYYASECEFFLKINCKQKLIGIVKGRVEFKKDNEVWFTDFLLDNENRNEKISIDILDKVMHYFCNSYGIDNFFAAVKEEDIMVMEFWKGNQFKIQRISKNYYDINEEKKDMFILKCSNYK
jgi:hypothetical protein